MKKIFFTIVLMLSVVNCYSIEITEGANAYTCDFKKTFEVSFIQTQSKMVEMSDYDVYVLIDYKSGTSFDKGTCRVTFYGQREDGTYLGKSAVYDNVALIHGTDGVESYTVCDLKNGLIASVGIGENGNFLIIEYVETFKDVDIKFN